jgi:hypothetical protein
MLPPVGGTVGSYTPFEKHQSVLNTGYIVCRVIYSLNTRVTRFMQSYAMVHMLYDTEKFPRLQYRI